ncbi:PIN domain-containing protein [Ornithinimicrobium sp. LYQ121]|uniref:PIN domain-containing protein n=1 Tax=Ornithinimicrobium sp. LYQ121 TaxID=3378801 RepID=UPI003851E93E
MAHGLFDGFEGYRSVTEEHLQEAVKGWLVVLDTNVLLHLYNYQGQALDDFMRVFEALGERLFVPHQVLDEFWRNRSTVLRENKGRHLERETIERAFDSIASDLSKWYQRAVSRTDELPEDVIRELDEAREAVLACMDGLVEQRSTTADTPTQQDPVISRLERLLAGKVGTAPSERQRAELLEEGKRRIQRRIPPGYMDAEKKPERAVGDFVVWRQVMDESQSRGLPVLLVTQDTKEDWWADRGTAAMRARPELVTELLEYSGQRLIMVRTHDLLRLGALLGVDVNDETLAEALEEQSGLGGWTDELYVLYLEYLSAWPGHHEAFIKALQSRGRIARTPLARLIGKKSRSAMRGTSVPYATALKHMCLDHDLDAADLDVPFKVHYTDGWMDYFFIPDPHFEAILRAVGDVNALRRGDEFEDENHVDDEGADDDL